MAISSHTRSYDLEQPRYYGAPIHPSHAPGYVYTLHSHHAEGAPEARTSASGRIYMAEHSGTHIDALCHQAEQCCLYGGRKVDMKLQTPTGFTELGVETLEPIVTRGVLLDVARMLNVERVDSARIISRADLVRTMEQQQTPIQRNDVALVRTGNGALWHDPVEYLRGAGMASDASLWMAELGVKAVGADNMAWDAIGPVDAELKVTLPGHMILLVRHGIYIIENLYLEGLARDQCYDFTLVCIPLKLVGATGSPVRPVALM